MEINTLESTVQLMLSGDYRDRFKAEYYQLCIRYNKLTGMLFRYDNGKLEFVPKCPIEVLRLQSVLMKQMLVLLEQRAKMEGVDLCL